MTEINFMRNVFKKRLLLFHLILFLLLPVCSSYSQMAKSSGKWKKFDVRILSFTGPSELVLTPLEGDDSEVWGYNGPHIELIIDFGLHSEKDTENKNEDDYYEKSVIIDNRKATIAFFTFKDSNSREFKYVAAAYFTGIDSEENNLSFVVYSKTSEQQKIAEQIFRSIIFKNRRQSALD